MNRHSNLGLVCALLFLAAPVPALLADSGPCVIRVAEPHDRQEVGQSITIRGTAQIPAGHHLWVLVKRSSFKNMWWIQGEGDVDPVSGEWRVLASFGVPSDIGWDFDVAVVAFAGPEHLNLDQKYRKSMETGQFLPISMPTAACPLTLLKVKKTSHN